MGTISWFAADWGTTHLRLWALDADGGIVWQRDSDEGMGRLAPGGAFETALVRVIGADMPDREVSVIVCGMAGSRQGWSEAPYATTPCAAPGVAQATRVATSDPRLKVHILPGVKQDKPADVMRGEETQIAGLLARDPEFDGVICLPGTHTKWVRISAQEIVSFQTFMTGELFALLASQSVLRHGISPDGWDGDVFGEAVGDAIARPQGLATQLFGIRSSGLLAGLAPVAARSRLSGLLIGAELAGARPYWLGQRIAMLGADGIADAYVAALDAQGAQVERVDATELTLDGLRAAHATLKEHA